MVPLQLRLLGSEAYGLLGFLAAYEVATQVIDNCLSITVTRELSRSFIARLSTGESSKRRRRHLASSYETVYAAYAVGVIVILGSASGLVVPNLSLQSLTRTVIWEAAFMLILETGFRVMASGYRAMHQGLLIHGRMAALTSSTATLRWVGGLSILAFLVRDVRAFLVWSLACQVIEAVGLRASVVREIGRWKQASLETVKQLIQPAWPFVRTLGFMSVSATIVNQADRVVLGLTRPLTELGSYYFAKNMAGGFAIFATAVVSAWLPRFSKLIAAGDRRKVFEEYRQTTDLLIVLSVPVACVAVLRPHSLLVLLGGQAMAQAAWTLRFFVCGFVLYVLYTVPYVLQLAHGRSDVPLRINIISLPLVWIATVICTSRWGVSGAAFVFLALNVCAYVGTTMWTSSRLLSEPFRLRSLAVPAALVALPVCLIHVVATERVSEVQGIAVELAVAGVTTLVALILSPSGAVPRSEPPALAALPNARLLWRRLARVAGGRP